MRLGSSHNKLIHEVENSLTIINKSHEHVVENRNSINDLTTVVNIINSRLLSLRSSFASLYEFENTVHILDGRIDRVIYQSTLSLQLLDDSLTSLVNQLDKALREELSLSLVSPALLQRALQTVSTRLPRTLTLHDFTGNSILWYYKNLKVMILCDQDRLHLVTVLPLIPTNSLFTLYKIVNIPIPVLSSNLSRKMILESDHFALAQNGDQFLMLKPDEIFKCSREDTRFVQLNTQFIVYQDHIHV